MRVVGVHGIGHRFEGSEMMKGEWFPALRDGLSEAGCKVPIGPDDFTMVAYGALFRRDEPVNRGGHRGPPVHLERLDPWEEELVEAMWREASALSLGSSGREGDEAADIQGPNFNGRRAPQIIQTALLQLAKSRFVRALGGEKAMVSELRQVRLFLHDPELKKAVLQRVAECVTPETRVIVGHSLGSVVAYEALCANPEWRVDTLVTLGSPLGIPNLVFDALTPRPRNGVGAWPNVLHWSNVADVGDLVALEKKLAPRFGGRVVDLQVYNGWHSHDVARYLSSGVTGKAIADALEHCP